MRWRRIVHRAFELKAARRWTLRAIDTASKLPPGSSMALPTKIRLEDAIYWMERELNLPHPWRTT